MKVDIDVKVDVQDVFDQLDKYNKSTFILENIECVDSDDLVEVLKDRGYDIDVDIID